MLSLEYLASLAERFRGDLWQPVREFAVKGRNISANSHASIMGVINLSADSWYRESVCLSTETAIRRAFVLQEQGADVIDIGAESTLAQAAMLSGTMQDSKLLPVLEGLRGLSIPISVETYHLEVARRCLEAGARIINLTGTENTFDFYKVARDFEAAVIICFVQGKNVRAVGDLELREDPIPILYEYFAREAEKASAAQFEKLFIDPGLGFYYKNLQDSAERVRHQMRVFLNTFRLRKLGYPVCHALPHAFEYFGEEVRSAEPFFAVLAAMSGTTLFRTHEVAKTKAVLDTMRQL